MSPRFALVLPLMTLLACGRESNEAPAPDSGGDASAVSRSDPSECADTTPFLSEACAVALQRRCSAATNERDCVSHPVVSLQEDQYEFHCAWAKVVRFSDVATCTVAETRGQCDAYIAQSIRCADRCDPAQQGGLYGTLIADVGASTLMQPPCVGQDILDGPISAYTTLSNQNGTPPQIPCGADSPAPPAELCACTQAACDSR